MDDRLLASGGRVQGLALRTEADFFAQLRASPSAATPVPGSATRTMARVTRDPTAIEAGSNGRRKTSMEYQ